MFISAVPAMRILSSQHRRYATVAAKAAVVAAAKQTRPTPNNDACQFNGLVLGLYEKQTDLPNLTTSARVFDQSLDGGLMKAIRDFNLSGKSGTVKVLHNFEDKFGAVAVVGLGPECIALDDSRLEMRDLMMENVRVAAALGCKRLQQYNCDEIAVDAMGYPEQAAEGGILSIWRYQEHIEAHRRDKIPLLELYESDENSGQEWISGVIRAEAQNMARYMCEMPANLMTPYKLGEMAINLLCPCGVQVDVRDAEWIDTQKLQAFTMVTRSAIHSPKFLEINYSGGSSEAPVLLVGKGLTYNNGGLCLKREGDLAEYRADMCGAAVLIAAIRAAAGLQLPMNIVGLVPICENVVSRLAIRPGDVAAALNGINVMAEDADLPGVLTLADTLVYGVRTYKSKNVISLSGSNAAVHGALGEAATPVYSNSDCLLEEIGRAGCTSGDRVWKMPYWNYFHDKVSDKRSVDLRNRGFGAAVSCKKAAIFSTFVPNTEWLHMDIHGVGMLKRHDHYLSYLQKGHMTGRPTRTLVQMLTQMAERCKKMK